MHMPHYLLLFAAGEWQVYVRTSDIEGAATCAQVYLTVYGSKGTSRILPLGDGSPDSDSFWRGKESQFKVRILPLPTHSHTKVGC